MTFFISLGKRLDSFIFDSFIFSFVSGVFFSPFIALSDNTSGFLKEICIALSLFGVAVSLCKDSIGGQSPCKRHFDLLVINSKTGEVASPFRCFVRNVFFFFYTLDFILLLLNQSNRKVGDWIAGTRVIHINPYKFVVPSTSRKKVLITFVISYCFVILIALTVRTVLWN